MFTVNIEGEVSDSYMTQCKMHWAACMFIVLLLIAVSTQVMQFIIKSILRIFCMFAIVSNNRVLVCCLPMQVTLDIKSAHC